MFGDASVANSHIVQTGDIVPSVGSVLSEGPVAQAVGDDFFYWLCVRWSCCSFSWYDVFIGSMSQDPASYVPDGGFESFEPRHIPSLIPSTSFPTNVHFQDADTAAYVANAVAKYT